MMISSKNEIWETTNNNQMKTSGVWWYIGTRENWGWVAVSIPKNVKITLQKVRLLDFCVCQNSNTKAFPVHLLVFGDWLWEVIRIKWGWTLVSGAREHHGETRSLRTCLHLQRRSCEHTVTDGSHLLAQRRGCRKLLLALETWTF